MYVAGRLIVSRWPGPDVVNGERNKMTLEIENKSPMNVTLKSASGSIHDADSGKLIKNVSNLPVHDATHYTSEDANSRTLDYFAIVWRDAYLWRKDYLAVQLQLGVRGSCQSALLRRLTVFALSRYKPKEVLLKIWVNYDDGVS